MSIASSKLNGCGEAGFAFGMGPPWVVVTARSSADTSCWHASPLACSAFCYHIGEDVRVLAVIVPVAELRQVQRQIGFADLMVGADYPTLQQAPEAIQVRGMDVPAHIFTLRMAHRLVRIAALSEALIACVRISRHERHALTNSLLYKTLQCFSVHLLDNLRHHIALTSNSPNDRDLAMCAMTSRAAFASDGHVLILKLSADIRLVYPNFAHELWESAVLHGGADTMAHIPGRPVGPASDDALNLQGANPLLAGQDQVDYLKPCPQGVVRVLKDSLTDHRKAVAVALAARLPFADPVKRTALDGKHFGIVAAWACDAIRPSALLQERLARVLILEAGHQLRECLSWFHRLASVILRPFYRVHDVVSSRA
jgi:hypothetical protein